MPRGAPVGRFVTNPYQSARGAVEAQAELNQARRPRGTGGSLSVAMRLTGLVLRHYCHNI